MHRPLADGRVQRLALARVGGCEVALVNVRLRAPDDDPGRGETVYVVLAAGVGVGTCHGDARADLRRAMREAPSPSQARWRARLEGLRVAAVARNAVFFTPLPQGGDGGLWAASADDARGLVLSERAPGALEPAEEVAPPALAEAGRRLVERLVRTSAGMRRDALRRALVKAFGRVDRRREAIRRDLDRMRSAETAADQARLFVVPASGAPRGATRLVADDWSSGAPVRIEMKLDPARSPREQIEAVFRRARRLRQASSFVEARLAETDAARDRLAELQAALGDARDEALDELETRARSAAPRDFRLESPAPAGPHAAAREEGRASHRTFLGAGGRRIFVGRGAADNDTLTFRVARPHDLWLHAKGWTGAHVIVPIEKGSSCPGDLLAEAAHLAAHFSDARGERLVEVQYAPRRYLRKPRGSAPGLVVVDREKVLALRRDDDLLRRLLANEMDPR